MTPVWNVRSINSRHTLRNTETILDERGRVVCRVKYARTRTLSVVVHSRTKRGFPPLGWLLDVDGGRGYVYRVGRLRRLAAGYSRTLLVAALD